MFKNIFDCLFSSRDKNEQSQCDFRLLVETHRNKMIQEGRNVNYTNWEHYAKVLEARHQARS